MDRETASMILAGMLGTSSIILGSLPFWPLKGNFVRGRKKKSKRKTLN